MSLSINISNTSDGNMKVIDDDKSSVLDNQKKFLEKNNINPAKTTYVKLTYDRDDYCQYKIISDNDMGDGIVSESTIIADGLVVTKPNHALFLPLADCIGAVIYDKKQNVLMLSHFGRQNLCDFGGTKSIEFLVNNFGIDPNDLEISFSPAAGRDNYPLFAFNNRGLVEVAIEQINKAGVPIDNIHVSDIDTTTDEKYFSHSQFLIGKRPTDGRFAIAAMIKE